MLCRVGEVIGSRIIWIHLKCVHLLHVYGMYKGGTSDLRKREDSRSGSRGGGVFRKGGSGPPPSIIEIYISENNISRFSAISGGNFVCLFKFFRLPSLTCYQVITSSSNESTSSLSFNDFADCLGNFLVVQRSYTFYTSCAEQLLFFVKPPIYIPVHSNLTLYHSALFGEFCGILGIHISSQYASISLSLTNN